MVTLQFDGKHLSSLNNFSLPNCFLTVKSFYKTTIKKTKQGKTCDVSNGDLLEVLVESISSPWTSHFSPSRPVAFLQSCIFIILT